MKSGPLLLVLCTFVLFAPVTMAAEAASTSMTSAALAASDGDRPLQCYEEILCADGERLSCGGMSCQRVEPNCAIGQPGSVTCDGVQRSCPSCPPPPCSKTVTVWCRSGGSVSCTGTCSSTFAVQPSCPNQPGYVSCDGSVTSCPSLVSCTPSKPWICPASCIGGGFCDDDGCCTCG